MKKFFFIFFYCFTVFGSIAQIKTTADADALMNRCKNFDESKADSLLIYSQQLEAFGQKEKYNNAVSDAMRLKGWYYEAVGNFDSAATMHLKNIDYAFGHVDKKKAVGLYSDMVNVYKFSKLFDKAKEFAYKLMEGSRELKDTIRMSSGYMNMGICYRNLKQNDSAFYCYNEALKLKSLLKDSAGMANLRINLSSYYYHENDFAKAYETILPNIAYHERSQDKDNLWYDYAAASTALNGLGRFAESQKYLYQASLIIDSSAKNKKAELCRIYSELYRMQGDYKKAFIYLDSASDLEIEFVNEDHSRLIAETTEKFQTEKREQQNKLLVAQVNSQKLQKRNVIIVAIAIALLALLVAIGLWQKQKANKSLQAKNEIINRQVNKLHELNQEKNSLISIVSHDLANPFGVISVWAQVLKQGGSQLNADEKEALQQIQNSAANGRQLIDSILDVEKASTGNIEMKLEPLECKKVISDVVQEMQPMAQKKQQQILFEGDTVSILSDKKVLSRICENLVSNAIKYSAEGKTIFVQVKDVNENAVLTVKDEGTGIAEDELPLLFTKYSRLSSKTTGGEKSTGLGLSIVKRLVTELNGKIVAESTVGKGSSFTVTIPK